MITRYYPAETILREAICDTCMMPIEVKNPWNKKEME